jgi:hypothetical protein
MIRDRSRRVASRLTNSASSIAPMLEVNSLPAPQLGDRSSGVEQLVVHEDSRGSGKRAAIECS